MRTDALGLLLALTMATHATAGTITFPACTPVAHPGPDGGQSVMNALVASGTRAENALLPAALLQADRGLLLGTQRCMLQHMQQTSPTLSLEQLLDLEVRRLEDRLPEVLALERPDSTIVASLAMEAHPALGPDVIAAALVAHHLADQPLLVDENYLRAILVRNWESRSPGGDPNASIDRFTLNGSPCDMVAFVREMLVRDAAALLVLRACLRDAQLEPSDRAEIEALLAEPLGIAGFFGTGETSAALGAGWLREADLEELGPAIDDAIARGGDLLPPASATQD